MCTCIYANLLLSVLTVTFLITFKCIIVIVKRGVNVLLIIRILIETPNEKWKCSFQGLWSIH